MSAAYEAIFFDLGGVVVDVESDRLIHQVAQLIGRTFEEVHAAVYHEELLLPLELGQIKPRDYYEGLKRFLDIPWTYEQFVRSWNDILRENSAVTQLVHRLRRHHKLIALSNTNELHLNHMKAFPSLSMLDDWVASCDVGLRKPDPEIYRLALRRVGVGVEAAIYIDDRPELVEAGRSAGLTAIRCENGAQVERDLRALGVTLS